MKVWSSTTTNCSGFSSDPAFIWKVGNPPTVTARSKDHFTSSRGHRRAVVKLRVLAQLERHRHAVGRDLPALGQLRLRARL